MGSGNQTGMNAMAGGLRVDCILGNAKIRDFSVATEVLQGKVMTFVNQIAEIVHGVVDEFGGAANKNNGETFILVWRCAGKTPEVVSKMADMAMLAFARVLGAVHRSTLLSAYREHPALKQRLGNGCRVNLSFGLHYGWAIEGAVGSEFKIDASYLSPHVSIADSVEHATRVYDINICATHLVAELCTKDKKNDMGQKLRLIDTVMIKGSKVPIHLYALDLDCMSLQVDVAKPRRFVWNLRQRYRARQLLEAEKHRKWSSTSSMAADFDASHDVQIMRRRYTEEFLETFKMGYQCYSEGEWEPARTHLSEAQTLLGTRDGPSVALLRLMEMYNFKSPEWWEGLHHFGEGFGAGGTESEPTSRRQSFGLSSPLKSRTLQLNNNECSTT
jgi:class 3 adenylate cyclase